MKILKTKNIYNCRQVTTMVDILLDSVITKEFIEHLSDLGKLTYMPEFPKPYFKIILSLDKMIVGCQGNSNFRIIINNCKKEDLEELINTNFLNFVEKFNQNQIFATPVN
ncbi:MAG: hypothetical protein WCT77_03865 [Bacteroidota bacterium]|jgi:hypothetical protein